MEFVTVGDKEYRVIKTGRAQAEQVLAISKWISKHGVPAIQALQDSGVTEDANTNVEFLIKALDALTADALIDLFTVAIGCSPEDSEVYFDIATLIDVVIEIYQRQPSVQRLLDRFFSQPNLAEVTLPESSTTSDEPTDGQMT